MNCPICFSVMYTNCEIHTIDQTTQRMDLHCQNGDCPTRQIVYKPHMGVLMRPNERWKCFNYHLPFPHKDKWYTLEGRSSFGYMTIVNQLMVGAIPIYFSTSIHQIWGEKKPLPRWLPVPGGAINTRGLDQSSLITVDFIHISTDNDMHLEAQKLFNRLIRLVPFV